MVPAFEGTCYASALTGAAASLVGGVVGLAAYAKTGYNSPEMQQLSLNGLPYLYLGVTLRKRMFEILHASSPAEPRANRFAKNNADVELVSLLQ